VIGHVLFDVFSAIFGEVCLWERSKSPASTEEWNPMIGFLAALIGSGKIGSLSIRKSLSPFRPSLLSELIPISVTLKLRQRFPDFELQRIISEVFPDHFLYQCFIDPGSLGDILLADDLVAVFPFVSIRLYIRNVFLQKIDSEAAAVIISQIGLPSILNSSRIVAAVIDPIFEHICESIFGWDIKNLEMSSSQFNKVVSILTTAIPILKVTISANIIMQPQVLSRLQKLLAKRGFEPKGLCFTWFSFMHEKGILHDSAFNKYLRDKAGSPSPGKDSVLLEINTFLLPLISGTLPDGALAPKPGPQGLKPISPIKKP
jgi:hypothetical protein